MLEKMKKYKQYCFDSTKLTLLIDFAMEPKVENALIKFVEEKIKEAFGLEALWVYVYHESEADRDISKRLKELCQCTGIIYVEETIRENKLYEILCKGICPGKNRYFYKVSADGHISICAKANPGEYEVGHLIKGIFQRDVEDVEAHVRKDPFLDEDCRDCHKIQNCFGGCAYDGSAKSCVKFYGS